MNCPTNPTVSILKEKETDSTNNRLAQLCDRENIKELDIVAKYNNELIVVEVKSRKDIRFGNPEEAVNDRKIRHIIASTDAYLRKFAIDLPVRFDIITVVGQEAPFQIEHIADAFYSPIW